MTDKKKPNGPKIWHVRPHADYCREFVWPSDYESSEGLDGIILMVELSDYEKLQSEVSRLKTELANIDYERNMETSALHAERDRLQNEVERLKNTYEPVEGPPMTPEEDASFMAKIDDIFKSPDVQEILKEINERRKQKEERNRKADAYDDLQAKLQSAEAEIDRQISLRKASESVDEEYRAKLEAAEAGLRFEHQAKQQRVLSVTLENAALREKLQAAEAEIKTLKLDPYPLAEKLFNVTKERDQAEDDARRLAEALDKALVYAKIDLNLYGEVKNLRGVQEREVHESRIQILSEALTPEIRERYLK